MLAPPWGWPGRVRVYSIHAIVPTTKTVPLTSLPHVRLGFVNCNFPKITCWSFHSSFLSLDKWNLVLFPSTGPHPLRIGGVDCEYLLYHHTLPYSHRCFVRLTTLRCRRLLRYSHCTPVAIPTVAPSSMSNGCVGMTSTSCRSWG